MRALLITPTYFPVLTGNAVTVERIAKGLREGGALCRILQVQRDHGNGIPEEISAFGPRVIHNFHAFKSGPLGLAIKKRLFPVPMITTLTGTDLNLDIHDPKKRDSIREVLAHSEAITVFNQPARDILQAFGIPSDKVRVIHQSVSLPPQQFKDYRSLLKIPPDAMVFLLIGAIRGVKAFGVAVEVLKEVKAGRSDLHLLIAGPVVEQEEFAGIKRLIEGSRWISYLGEVPRENIESLFLAAEVVVNTSLSESEPNSILEALNFGKIVIARDIPGNSSLIKTGETGFAFQNSAKLKDMIVHVLDNYEKLGQMKGKAKKLAAVYSYEREKAAYLELYRGLSASCPGK